MAFFLFQVAPFPLGTIPLAPPLYPSAFGLHHFRQSLASINRMWALPFAPLPDLSAQARWPQPDLL